MTVYRKDGILSPFALLIKPLMLLTIIILTLLGSTSLFAQTDIYFKVGDTEFKSTDSSFAVPFYLQNLTSELVGFQVLVSFDSDNRATFDMSNPVNYVNDVIGNWGITVDDFGSSGRTIKIIGWGLGHGEPMPPSEEIYLLFSLNAIPGDQIIESECNQTYTIRLSPISNYFSDPAGNTLDYIGEDGSYFLMCYDCGDANDDGLVNVSDAVFIVGYVFNGGVGPFPIQAGDVNCDGKCNVSDAVYIINYVFSGGRMPCDTDGNGSPDC